MDTTTTHATCPHCGDDVPAPDYHWVGAWICASAESRKAQDDGEILDYDDDNNDEEAR